MKNSIWMRLALIILSVSMVLSLAACNPGKEDVTTDKETDQKTEVETPAETEATTEDVEDTTEKTPDESETKPVETTETKPVETTEKKPVETTEKKPAETTEKPDEPVVELPLNVYLTAEQLAPKVTGAKFSKVELSADKSYVSIYGADQGDAYFNAYSGTEVTGQYLVLKYRYPATNTTINPTRIEVYLSATNTGAVGGDNLSIPVTVDGEWHVVILDAATTNTSNGIVANEDGTYSFKYVRLDILNDTTPASDCIDVAYFGITDSIEDALKLNKDMKTVTFAEKGTSKDHIKTLYTSTGTTTPTPADVVNIFVGPEQLATAPVNNKVGNKELAADGSYVRYYGNGNGDGNLTAISGNTAVSGQYLVIKYRYPSTNVNNDKYQNIEIFASCTNPGAVGGDNAYIPVKADGEWHVCVIDFAQNKSNFVANEDGTYSLKYARFDILNTETPDTDCIDVAYIAVTDNVDNLLAANKDSKTVTYKHSGTDVQTLYTSTGTNLPAMTDVANKYFDAEDLAGKAPSGTNIGKVELSEDKSYVSIYGKGQPDGFFAIMSGNTDVTGPYLVMKYRYPATNAEGYAPNARPLFAGNVMNGPTGKDTTGSFPVIADGEWHMTVFNIAAHISEEWFAPAEDGTYALKYLRFDIADNLPEDCCIDIQYIALTDDVNNLLPVAKGEGLYTVEARLTADGTVVYYPDTNSTTPPADDDEDETGTGDEPGTGPVEPEVPVYEVPYYKYSVDYINGLRKEGANQNGGVGGTKQLNYAVYNYETNKNGHLTISGWFIGWDGVEKYQYTLDGGYTWIDFDMSKASDLSSDPNNGVIKHITANESAVLNTNFRKNGSMNGLVVDLSDYVDEDVVVTVRAILSGGDAVEFLQILNVFANCTHFENTATWTPVAGDIQNETCVCTSCNKEVVRNVVATTEGKLVFGADVIADRTGTAAKLMEEANGLDFVRLTASKDSGVDAWKNLLYSSSVENAATNVAKYVGVLYRTSTTGDSLEIFLDSTANDAQANGNMTQKYGSANNWHFAILNYSNNQRFNGEALTALRLDWLNAARKAGDYVDFAFVAFFTSENAAIEYYETYVDAFLGTEQCDHLVVTGEWVHTGTEGDYRQKNTCDLCDGTAYRACPHDAVTGEWAGTDTTGKIAAPCACCGYVIVKDCAHPTAKAKYTAVEGELFAYDVVCELCSFEGKLTGINHEGLRVMTPDELNACSKNDKYSTEVLTEGGMKYMHAVMTANKAEGTLTLNVGSTALTGVGPYVAVMYRRVSTAPGFQLYANAAGHTEVAGSSSPTASGLHIAEDGKWHLYVFDISGNAKLNAEDGYGWVRLDIFDGESALTNDYVDLGFISFFNSREEAYNFYGSYIKKYNIPGNDFVIYFDGITTNGGASNVDKDRIYLAPFVADLTGKPFGTSLKKSFGANGWCVVAGGTTSYKYRVIGESVKEGVYVPSNEVSNKLPDAEITKVGTGIGFPANCGDGAGIPNLWAIDFSGFEEQTVTVEIYAVSKVQGDVLIAKFINYAIPCTHENNTGTWTTDATNPQYENSDCSVCEKSVSRLLTDSEEGLLFFNHEYIKNKAGSVASVKTDGPNGMSYVRIMSAKDKADVPVKDKPGEFSWAEQVVSLVSGSTVYTNVGQYVAILYRTSIKQQMQFVCWDENGKVDGNVQYFSTNLDTADQWKFVIKKNVAYSAEDGQKLTQFRFDYFDTYARTLNDYTDVAYVGFFSTEQAAKDFYAKYAKAYMGADYCDHSFDYNNVTSNSVGKLTLTCAYCGSYEFACQHYDVSKLTDVTDVTTSGSIANITANCSVCGATGVGVATKTHEGKKLYNPGELFSKIGTSGGRMSARVITDDASVKNMPYTRFVDVTGSEGYIVLNSGTTAETGVANYVAILYRTWRNPQMQFWINKAGTINEKGVAGSSEESNITAKYPYANNLVKDGTWEIAIIDLSKENIVDTTNGNGWIRLDIMDTALECGTVVDIAYIGFFTTRAAAAEYHAMYVDAYLTDDDCGCRAKGMGLAEYSFYDFNWVSETKGEMKCGCKYCGREMTPIACGHLDNVTTPVEGATDLFTYNVKCNLCGFDGVLSGITSDGLKVYTPADLMNCTTGNMTHSPATDAALSNMPYTEIKLGANYNGERTTLIQGKTGDSRIFNTGRYVAILYRRNNLVPDSLEMFISSKSNVVNGDNFGGTTAEGEWGFYVYDTNSRPNYDPEKGLNVLRLDTLNGAGAKTAGATVDVAFIGFFDSTESANAFYTSFAAAYPATPVTE